MTTAPKTLTGEVADFIQGLSYDKIPDKIRKELKRCVLDGIGVALSGAPAQCSVIIQKYIKESGSTGNATVIGAKMKANASQAALANGVAAHAEDYDDTQLSPAPNRIYGLLTHPTTPALSGTLAVAEEVGASGRDFLTAFAIAMEVECKIADAINPDHYGKGHHSTGTIGVFAAAAGAAKLWKLSPTETRHAIGIAASKSAGLRVNFGTMTKPYHAGAAAENGVVAARLAKMGYQADPNTLDGQWGYFQVKGGGVEPERLMGKLGNPYTLEWPGVSVKPYPCGSLLHPSLDALLDLMNEHKFSAEQVDKLRLCAGNNILLPLRYKDPQNELEAKFSPYYMLASMLLRKKAGLREFTEEAVHDPKVRAVMHKIETFRDKEIEAKGSARMLSRVEVYLKDGRVLKQDAFTSRGQPDRPMSQQELEAKFTDCALGVLAPERITAALAVIRRVDELASVRELTAAVA